MPHPRFKVKPKKPPKQHDTCRKCFLHFIWHKSTRSYCYWCETGRVG